MDYEKYYYRKNDSYIIHFPNFKGISVDELTKMFSVYGRATIDASRGQFGLCFVRYKSLEDTIKSIKGFKDSEIIKILPHKNKLSKKDDNKNITNNKQKPWKPKAINLCSSEQAIHKQSDSNNLVSRRDSDCDTSIRSELSVPQLLKIIHMKNRRSSPSISSEISDHDSTIMENIFNEDEIPSLIYKTRKIIIPAQEAIIANIDPSVGVKEILTLLKDYHPIAASFIKQVPNSEIRYIHAYFTTVSDALAVEKKFDKYLLREHVLIVLRPEILMKEAF